MISIMERLTHPTQELCLFENLVVGDAHPTWTTWTSFPTIDNPYLVPNPTKSESFLGFFLLPLVEPDLRER